MGLSAGAKGAICRPAAGITPGRTGNLVGISGTPAPENAALTGLLQRCGTGDAGAFRSLYELQSGRLYGIALRITREPALAADALHDALLQVWRHANKFDPARGPPEAWLTGLARYRAMDILRKRGRERVGAPTPESPDEAPGPLDVLLTSREGKAIHDCIRTLETAQQRVILLAFVDGLTHAEIAAQTGSPLGTVKSLVRRGLLALKECLTV